MKIPLVNEYTGSVEMTTRPGNEDLLASCHFKTDRHYEEARRSNLSLHASLSTTIDASTSMICHFEGARLSAFVNTIHMRLSLPAGRQEIYHYGNATILNPFSTWQISPPAFN